MTLLAVALPFASEAAAQQDETVPALVAASGDGAVARSIRGIISYTRWPVTPSALRLCLVGETAYREQIFAGVQSAAGRLVKARQITPDRFAVQNCDVLYFGGTTGVFATGLARPGILTISEQDVVCRGGAMFCLGVGPERVSFRLNLDAVARSGLRIDPKVLIMGRATETLP